MNEQFVNCPCCQRCAQAGSGTCDPCKESGCHRQGPFWKRGATCPMRSKRTAKGNVKVGVPRDARNTERLQGNVGQVQCRWCTRRFNVWTKTKRGAKRSWKPAMRMHVNLRHKWEAKGVENVLEMIKEKESA